MWCDWIMRKCILQRKCGWIRIDTGPEMLARQEMMPHIAKTELEFNDVGMDEGIGGGNDTTNKIISRDPYK